MEQLRDIKDIVEVSDSSFEMLLGLLFLLLVVFFVIFYLYKNRRKRKKRLTPKEVALDSLKSIDYTNPKEVAYRFTTDGYLWLDEQNQSEYQEIEKELLPYKYKREVPPLDGAVESRIKKFIEELK